MGHRDVGVRRTVVRTVRAVVAALSCLGILAVSLIGAGPAQASGPTLNGAGSSYFAVAINNWVAQPAANPASSVASSDPHKSAAESAATALLASARLPSGSTVVAKAPAPVAKRLAQPPADIGLPPYLVDESALYSSPHRWGAIVRWVRTHPAAGGTDFGSGSEGSQQQPILVWEYQRFVPGQRILARRELIISVAPPKVDGLTYLRVDSQVVWYPTRPTVDRVPPTVSQVTMTTWTFNGSGDRHPVGQPTRTTDPTQVARLVTLANSVPMYAYEFVPGCPGGPGYQDGIVLKYALPSGTVVDTLNAAQDVCDQLATLKPAERRSILVERPLHIERVARAVLGPTG